MSALEMLKALDKNGVLYLKQESENVWYVEDSESYAGSATITFDESGNCIKVESESSEW